MENDKDCSSQSLSFFIILDFIDMENDKDWEELLIRLEQSFARDKAKCKVLGRTKLGLIEVTRKKEGQTLANRYSQKCPQSLGMGRIGK